MKRNKAKQTAKTMRMRSMAIIKTKLNITMIITLISIMRITIRILYIILIEIINSNKKNNCKNNHHFHNNNNNNNNNHNNNNTNS